MAANTNILFLKKASDIRQGLLSLLQSYRSGRGSGIGGRGLLSQL